MTVNRIARWDGSSWSALTGPGGTGVSGTVSALTVFDDGRGPALYAGGFFTTAGGVTVNGIARWDGSSWSALTGPSGTGMNGTVDALAVFDDGGGPALYAGGTFTTAGGVTVNRIARWDGSSWSALTGSGGAGVNGSVRSLTVFDDGGGAGPALYVGGNFINASGVPVIRIARWDGASWSPLTGPGGTGMNGTVAALTVFDDGGGAGPALYAGGFFTTAGGVTVNNIARWDGSSWSALSDSGGTGVNSVVLTLTVFDDGGGGGAALYAGGQFPTAGGVTVNFIARWDGSTWSALTGPGGTGVDLQIDALTVFDGSGGSGAALYAGGFFTTAGGMTVNSIAKWQGCAVEPVPCVGDLTGDGVVDADDLGVLLGAFGTSDGGDLNGDGITDADDLGILLGVFGSVCE